MEWMDGNWEEGSIPIGIGLVELSRVGERSLGDCGKKEENLGKNDWKDKEKTYQNDAYQRH